MKIVLRLFVVVVLIVPVAACFTSSGTVPTATPVPTVAIKSRKSEIRNPEVVPYTVENCNGQSLVETNPSRSRSTTVEINLTLGGSVEFEAPVKAKLETEFSVSSGETVGSDQNFTLRADAGHRVTYEVTWSETWQVGDVEINGTTIPYEVRTGLKADVGSGTPETCPVTLTAQVAPAATVPPSSAPTDAPVTPTPEPPTPVLSSATPTVAPTDTSLPPSPLPPSPTTGTTIALHVFAARESLTLNVSEAVSLAGFQFGAIINGKLSLFTLVDRFDSLKLTGGQSGANDCYIYQAAGAAPPLSQSCKGQVYRTNVAASDVFWYDSVTNQPRDLAIFSNGQSTGTICSATVPDCSVNWVSVIPSTSVIYPSLTPLPPTPILPSTTPTVAPTNTLLSSPTIDHKYPCDAKIKGVPNISVSVVRVLPGFSYDLKPTQIRQGDAVILLDKQPSEGADWYQIRYANNKEIGWLPVDIVTKSPNCP